jgi:hypothetical protein
MRFYYGLPAALIGAAIVIVQPQVAAAFNPDDVKEIAKEITVLIPEKLADGNEANGSGSIIAREGNTYTVLTANHVVCKDQNDQCQQPRNQLRAVTPDGEEYPINFSTVKKIPGVDLAVFQFTSDKNYKVATLGNYELTGEEFLFASGWPDPKLSGDSQRKRHFNIGKVLPKEIVPLLKMLQAYEEVLEIAPNSNARQLRDKLREYLGGTSSQSQPPAATPATALPESSAPAADTTPLPAQPQPPQPVPPPQQQPPAGGEPVW